MLLKWFKKPLTETVKARALTVANSSTVPS